MNVCILSIGGKNTLCRSPVALGAPGKNILDSIANLLVINNASREMIQVANEIIVSSHSNFI